MKITVDGLTKQFGDVTAVSDLTVTFESGALTALLGPSGCGKSTMLYMLAGITPVTRGTISFDGQDVTTVSPEKRGVGLVFQNYALYPHMTVLQNICFPLEVQKVAKAERYERAVAMAKLVQIGELLDRRPAELSGGQQQRVAIARALIKKPRLLLLDEPLSNLDARLRLEMREEIRRIQQETGVTTIFVTHDQEEAMSISDEILVLRRGVYQQYGPPQELYDSPQNAFVAQFLGSPPINQISGFVEDQTFITADRSATCALPERADVASGSEAILALRPESILIATNGRQKAFDATVLRTYKMGKEELTYLQLGSSEIRAYISRDVQFGEAEQLPIALRDEGVFLFDPHTGGRLL